MIKEKEKQIMDCEALLLNAFTNKDITTLDELIHEDARFLLPNGQNQNKEMVLNNYRSGATAMSSITASDQLINFIDDTAIVSLILHLTGKVNDQVISSRYRYLRAWKQIDGQWKVIITSGVPLSN